MTVFFYCCQQETEHPNSYQVIERVDTVIVYDTVILFQKKGEKFVDPNQFVSYVFDDLCAIYSKPDTNSLQLATFGFKHKIKETYKHYRTDTVKTSNRPEGYYLNVKEVGRWKRIKYGEGEAFVETKHLADKFLTYYHNKKRLIILANKVNGKRYSVMLKSTDGSTLLDTLTFAYLSHGYELSMLDFNGLKNTDRIIKYRTYRESCPGGELTEFIALKDNQFTFLISSFSGGEEGEFDESTIYFPLKPYDSDSVFHVSSGNFQEIFNWSEGKLMNYNIPENITIPKNELIVKKRRYTNYILDENGEEKYNDKDGMYEVNVIEEKPKFHHWNGETLVEI